jgi:hypothetical protein
MTEPDDVGRVQRDGLESKIMNTEVDEGSHSKSQEPAAMATKAEANGDDAALISRLMARIAELEAKLYQSVLEGEQQGEILQLGSCSVRFCCEWVCWCPTSAQSLVSLLRLPARGEKGS